MISKFKKGDIVEVKISSSKLLIGIVLNVRVNNYNIEYDDIDYEYVDTTDNFYNIFDFNFNRIKENYLEHYNIEDLNNLELKKIIKLKSNLLKLKES